MVLSLPRPQATTKLSITIGTVKRKGVEVIGITGTFELQGTAVCPPHES